MGTTLSAYLNASLLYRKLHRQNVYRARSGLPRLALNVVAASAIMTAVLFALTPALAEWSDWSAIQRGLNLTALVALGLTIYVVSLLALGVRPRNFAADLDSPVP
jgi:putative peptidoglycan lipid II flippase